ncbi:hypothetical protein L3X38_044836 [Prunus dulcis]|uniref:Bulb-type lectin domain-containing protein n=1 Tax=Prunus dulcis TaxID=3755 RepID=A0AAD4UZ78_PRUDU|nr:hypothetical protein L3X38_044836 [Prunus dulcis]
MAFELAYPLCFLLLLLQLAYLRILPFSIIAQTYNNISLGSSHIAKDNNNSVWCSPYGEFAFGFQKIGSDGGFILAIWFNKIPEKTTVWSANGNNPVQQVLPKAVLLLTIFEPIINNKDPRLNSLHGQLMLNDIATGKQKRIADFGGIGVAYAAMLDTGNFVLANGNSNNLRESFDNQLIPTNTDSKTKQHTPG